MKTTVEIADPVLEGAKRLAEERHSTLKAIVDEALRALLSAQPAKPKFKLRDASFKGVDLGLSPEFANGTWAQILEEVYRGETDRAAANL